MRSEYGRSLIEVIGVLAITGVMSAAAISIYNSIHQTQTHTIAAANLEKLARDVKILLEYRGSYDGVSVSFLVKQGALANEDSPIGGPWTITAEDGGAAFAINLTGLSRGDCDYFAAGMPAWASRVRVNGSELNPVASCFSSPTNQVSLIVE